MLESRALLTVSHESSQNLSATGWLGGSWSSSLASNELSMESLVESALLSVFSELLDGEKSVVPASLSVDGSLSPDGASVGSLVVSLHNSGTSEGSLPLALGESLLSSGVESALLALSLKSLLDLGSLDLEFAPGVITGESAEALGEGSEALSDEDALSAISDELLVNELLELPADGLLGESLLEFLASLSALVESLDNSGTGEVTFPVALGVLVVSVGVDSAVLALSLELLDNLGALEAESWPLILDINWNLSLAEAFHVSSVGSLEDSALAAFLVHELLEDFGFPWPAYCLGDGSTIPDGASVGSLGESLDNLSTSHVSLPSALGELILSVNESSAFLSLSGELLRLSGGLEVEWSPLEVSVELLLLSEDASAPLSWTSLVNDAVESIVAVSLDDFLLSWPADGPGLVLLLPEGASLIALVEHLLDLGALPETRPGALSELVVSLGMSNALLALSLESFDYS